MGNPHAELNVKQKLAIRWLDNHRNDGDGSLKREHVIAETGLLDGEFVGLLKYLERGDHLHDILRSDGAPYAKVFMLKDTISEEIQQLDNPPPRDYPSDAKRWLYSKWWSLPLSIITVILPALVGYVTMIKTLIEWFRINE